MRNQCNLWKKEISEINSIEFKNWKKVYINELCEKIDKFDNNLNYDIENLLEFLTAYTMVMDKITDNVVPTKKAKVHTRKVCQPLYNNILRDQKNESAQKGDDFGENIKKNHEWLAFQMERSNYFRMLSAIRQQFYSNEFKKLKGDTKQLYKLVEKHTGNLKKNNLPDHASSDVISENLASFFINKILAIRDNLEQHDLYIYEWLQVHFPMASFKEVDEMCV